MNILFDISIYISISFMYFMLFIITNNALKEQRKNFIESVKKQLDKTENKSQINADMEELNKRFQTEDVVRIKILLRFYFILLFLIIILDSGASLVNEYWDAIAANRTLGRTFLFMNIFSLVFIGITFILEFVPFFKSSFKKQNILEKEEILFRFTSFSQRLKETKIRRFFSIFLGSSSILLFIASQVLLWGFIVF